MSNIPMIPEAKLFHNLICQFCRASIDPMPTLATLFLFAYTFTTAQDMNKGLTDIDTIYAITEPLDGYKSFQQNLETTLSGADTTGKKHRIRLNNIGFIVSKAGKIDSAWVIFQRRPVHLEIIKLLKETRWKAANEGGVPVASHQELYLNIHLTKAAIKKHRSWPSFGERLFAPWID